MIQWAAISARNISLSLVQDNAVFTTPRHANTRRYSGVTCGLFFCAAGRRTQGTKPIVFPPKNATRKVIKHARKPAMLAELVSWGRAGFVVAVGAYCFLPRGDYKPSPNIKFPSLAHDARPRPLVPPPEISAGELLRGPGISLHVVQASAAGVI